MKWKPNNKDPEEMFRRVPLLLLVESMQLILAEINRRKIYIKDYDNKDRHIGMFQVIKNQPYFMGDSVNEE